MNQIYIQSHLSRKPDVEMLKINKNIFKKEIFYKNFDTYESLIYAMDAIHGQSHDDRRFYYDPINNFFIPIYYDGKSKILNNENSDMKSLIFLESGSGAKYHTTCEILSYLKSYLTIPIIVGGGINTAESADALVKAGADYIVIGSKLEELPNSADLIKFTQAVHYARC